jgi:2-dehydro-3-deoxygluconokinase
MNKKYDILSIGSVYLDINSLNFPIDTSIPAEKETVGGSYLVGPGGSPTNFSKVAAFLDLKPVLIGKIGNDEIGAILNQKLEKKGITPALITSGAVQTNMGLNFISPSGVSVMTTIGTANQSLTADDVMIKLKTYLPEVNYLYLGGFFKLKSLIPHYKEMISMAKASGTKVILDHGRLTNLSTGEERSQLLDIMNQIDLYLPSQDEFLDLWQSQTIEYALQKARTMTQALIVVKQAERGATGSDHQQTVQVPAFPVAVVNTVGAGDSFNAGFIKAQLLNKNLVDSIKFANATAAIIVSQQTLPNLETIEKFITNNAHILQITTPQLQPAPNIVQP